MAFQPIQIFAATPRSTSTAKELACGEMDVTPRLLTAPSGQGVLIPVNEKILAIYKNRSAAF
jgi:hypothetical protein